MTDLSVSYMGLRLKNPLIAGSSPLTATADHIEDLARNGIGAVVLKSIFEEQITGEAAMVGRYSDYYPEAHDYLHAYLGANYMNSFTTLISEAKRRTDIPIIASINCMSEGKWLEFAGRITDAGADALVLSGGFVSKAPMYVMRGEMPIRTMTHYMNCLWLKYGVRMFGKMMIKNEPYSDLYFLDDALQVRHEVKLPLIYVGGCVSR